MNNDDRDMFYSNYGYAGVIPPMMNPNMNIFPNQTTIPNQPISNNNNSYETRISNLEKQVNRLNARVNRLENPYGNNQNNYNEPDNNMYMI